MHHGTVFGAVDGLAGKHRVTMLLDAALARQIEQHILHAGVDQVFRQVGKNVRRLLAEAGKSLWVCGECRAQIEIFTVLIKAALQLRPGWRAVAANPAALHGGDGHAASIRCSSFTASAAKARMPSANLSVAMASWLSA